MRWTELLLQDVAVCPAEGLGELRSMLLRGIAYSWGAFTAGIDWALYLCGWLRGHRDSQVAGDALSRSERRHCSLLLRSISLPGYWLRFNLEEA